MEGFVDWLAWLAAAGPPLALVGACIAAGTAVLVWVRTTREPLHEALDRSLRDAAVAAALALILVLTFRSAIPTDGYDRLRLVPFEDILDGTLAPELRVRAAVDVVGNLLVFVPIGAALAARFSGWSPVGLVAGVVVLAIAVEAAQLALNIGRTADVTDVLVEPAGALLGFWVWRSFARPRPRTASA